MQTERWRFFGKFEYEISYEFKLCFILFINSLMWTMNQNLYLFILNNEPTTISTQYKTKLHFSLKLFGKTNETTRIWYVQFYFLIFLYLLQRKFTVSKFDEPWYRSRTKWHIWERRIYYISFRCRNFPFIHPLRLTQRVYREKQK